MIRAASKADIRYVALHMRDRDLAEFSAVTPCDTREEIASFLAERYASADAAVAVCRSGGGPVCIGGLFATRPRSVAALFFATDDFRHVAIETTRFVRNNLFPRYFAAGFHRIEAVSLAEYAEMHEWLKTLGLKPETQELLNYGKRGESFVQFARIADARAPGAGGRSGDAGRDGAASGRADASASSVLAR